MIVDDSVLFRSQIQLALKECPDIEIVGVASNGKIAIDKMLSQEIDICTLDIEMPVLDGIETLVDMKARGITTRVIMFSSQSRAGAEKTLEALKLGAVDFVPKPVADDSKLSPSDKIKEALLPKILSIFGRKVPAARTNTAVDTSFKPHFLWEAFNPEILVIASSTGGPNALSDYFALLKDVLPFPILVTQHMPPIFTASLAERLGHQTGKIAREAINGELLKPNQIYVAPGNFHMRLSGDRNNTMILLDQGAQRNFVRPCADFLFESAARIFGRNTLGSVFTGMGRDGADGAAAIKAVSGAVMIQNMESCVVFGMPGAVNDAGHFDFAGTPVELANKTLAAAKIKRNGNVA
jgi:two-component system chemotaxis response regulator CheB